MNRPCIVVDACLILAFVLSDEASHPQAVALMHEFDERNTAFYAPSIFVYECDSVIRRRVHAKTLSPHDAQQGRELIATLNVGIEHDASILDRAYEIATSYGQPRIYDASYAAYAESRNLDFWTADKRFYNAVKNSLPFVKYLGNR